MVVEPSTLPQSQAPYCASAARVEVGAVGGHGRQRGGEGPRALLGHQRGDGVASGRVEPLDRVGEGVHAAGDGQVGRHVTVSSGS